MTNITAIDRHKMTDANNKTVVFTMDAPEPVMGKSYLDLVTDTLFIDNNVYQPPLSPVGLSKVRNAGAHQGSAITFRRNQLVKYFVPSPAISMADFIAAALDFLVFGNAYFQQHFNYFGQVVRLSHIPALPMRRMKDVDGQKQFCQLVKNGRIEFAPGEVLQAMSYDTGQQIYGIPDWICGLQSTLLNEDATLFRRRYYANGCHIGYILYTNDPSIDKEVEKDLIEKVKEGKGVGNFKSVYINIPNGKEKSVQVIPVGDISQKDEFEKIKNISADDIMVAHRIPPALAGMKPDNAGGFGDIEKISAVYVENEVKAMAIPFQQLNVQLPPSVQFRFDFPQV